MGESCLDHELSKKMASLIEDLTTSGNPSLNVDKMKGLKKICRTSDLYVEHAFHLLRTQLTREHSEIRLSAFQVVDELFNRSHAFRELLVSDFQNFLELTVETDHNQPLPPPRSAAVKLRSDTLKAIQQWQDKFGAAYKKLSLGYNYLKSCKHVDFSDIRARSQAERRRNELQQEQKQKALAAKLDKVQKEIAEQKKDIEDAAMEAENCLEFLVPKPDSLLFCKSDFNVPDKGSANQEMPPDLAAPSVSLQHNGQHHQECEQNTGERSKRSFSNIDENQISFPAARSTDGVSVEERDSETTDDNATGAYQSNKEKSSFNLLPEALGNAQHCQSRAQFEFDISGTRYFQVSENKNIENDDNESVDFENIEEENENRIVQAHGLGSRKYNLEIEIGTDKVSLVETEDNQDLFQSLKDAACLITMRYLPQIVKWLEVLSKAGASQSEIKAMINLKARLEQIKTKCTELQVVQAETASARQGSDSDDEFEEVPEKEGYEPVIPSHLRAEYGLDNGPDTSVVQKTAKMGTLSSRTHAVTKREMKMERPSTDKMYAPGAAATASKHKSTSSSWSLSERNGAWSSNDPTSRAANLAKLGLKDDRAGKTLSSKEKPSCTITSGESSNIPELPFGPDLAYWGRSDKIEAPTVVKNESLHRFWAPAQVEAEKPSQMEMAAIMNRTFHFVGNFVPVKWKCRVMLPSGKLCERMDRVKCPFHGKIIARDENGEPSNPEDVKVEVPETSMNNSSEIPPWLDAELQADIEAATGHDLGSERSKIKQKKKGIKGKAKGKKYPGLTDIKETNNTTRSRLEAKVFNRSAMKRVASRLDAADYKRLRDKFANQFNYAHK